MVDPLEALPGKVQAIEDKLDALGASVEARFEMVDARFDQVDARFAQVDARFDDVTFALVEQRQYTEFAFDRLRGEMTAGFSTMTEHFGRLERKLDQVIDRLVRPRSDF
jgi:hypothetical protein